MFVLRLGVVVVVVKVVAKKLVDEGEKGIYDDSASYIPF